MLTASLLQLLSHQVVGLQLLAATPDGPPPPPPPMIEGLWAGHQVNFGKRRIPLRGKMTTRVDNYVLAKITRRGDTLEISQRACDVKIKPVAGVFADMDVEHLPGTNFELGLRMRDPRGDMFQGTSRVQWSGEDDLDGDDNPGMTVDIGGRVCAGKLYVANDSRTTFTLTATESLIRGHAIVRVSQAVLGAKGVCLSTFARDTKEQVNGPVAYVPVAEGTTCEQLRGGAWPVDATRPSAKKQVANR